MWKLKDFWKEEKYGEERRRHGAKQERFRSAYKIEQKSVNNLSIASFKNNEITNARIMIYEPSFSIIDTWLLWDMIVQKIVATNELKWFELLRRQLATSDWTILSA